MKMVEKVRKTLTKEEAAQLFKRGGTTISRKKNLQERIALNWKDDIGM